MQQMIKKLSAAVLLVCGFQTAWAFVPGGDIGNGGDAWQVPTIGYGLGGDLLAPKNIGEEYRRNIPVLYYAYDVNFLDFFGTDGAAAVDSAFGIMNSLTNVSSYSSSLYEFPMNSQNFNYTAQALGLTDLKSATLNLLAEQMGLAEPDRYTWTLHDRYLPPGGACPVDEEYLVVQRNLDPITSSLNQVQYSPYVNGTLLTYYLVEACTGPNPLAVTEPFPVDPYAQSYTAVAALGIETGGFYGGLTRDDVAGLRYLWRTNNVNWETVPNGSLLGLITTNTANPVAFPPAEAFFNLNTNANTNVIGFYYFAGDTNGGFGYGDLHTLISYSSTNDPATLLAFYTGLVISSVSNTMVWTSNQTYSYSYTVPIGAPYGSDPVLTIKTNYQGYWKPYYHYQFANVFTNHIYTNTAKIVKTTIGPPIGSAYGNVSVTNTSTKTTNQVNGDFFVLPLFQTNFCPLDVIDATHYNVLAFTNVLSFTDTNLVTSSNSVSVSSVTYLVTYFTNYSYLVNPVSCVEVPNATGLYQGIENVKFVRANYDSLIGQFFQAITNNYSMVTVTNSQAFRQNFQRIITEPDFLISAEDQAGGPASIPGTPYGSRNINFDEGNVLPGLAGPGTIVSPTVFTFDKVGNIYLNGLALNSLATNSFLSEFTQLPTLAWGSFDGTTNDPVVYPNGTSIQDLENQILVQVTPVSLANGTNGVPYPSVTFTATGGSFIAPFTWSQTGLPSGMNLSSGGTLSGTPTQSGTFDFTLQLTDSLARSVSWNYSLTIQ